MPVVVNRRGGGSGAGGQYLPVPSTAALCYRTNYPSQPATLPNLGSAGSAYDMQFMGSLQWVPGPYGYTMSSALAGDGVNFPYTGYTPPPNTRQFVVAAGFRIDMPNSGSVYQLITSETFGVYLLGGSGSPALVGYFTDQNGTNTTFTTPNLNLAEGVDHAVAFAYDADSPTTNLAEISLDGRVVLRGSYNRVALANRAVGLSMVYQTHGGGVSVHWGEFHPGTVLPAGMSAAAYGGAQYAAMRGWT